MPYAFWLTLAGGAVLVPLLWWSVQNPIRGPLAAYAAVVPFGSAIIVPLPLPSPFDTLSTLLGVIACAAVVLYLLINPGEIASPPRSIALLALVIAVATAGWLYSIDRPTTTRAVVVLLSVFTLLVAVSLLAPTRRDLQWLRGAIIAGGAATGGYGVYMLLTGGLTAADGSQPRFATAGGGGETADPNITAASLLLPLVLAFAWLLTSQTGLQRVGAAATVTVISGGLLLTGSRGGLLAALAACAVLLLHLLRPIRALAVLGATVALFGTMTVALPAGILQHVQAVTSTGRAEVWLVGLRTCDRYCLTGAGLGSFPTGYRQTLQAAPELAGHGVSSYQAHDMWLALAVETGLLGVLLVLTALIMLVLDLCAMPRARRAAPLAALTGVIAANVLLNNFSFKYFWLVLIYCVLELAAHTKELREATEAVPVRPQEPLVPA